MTTRRFFACIALALGVVAAFNVFLALKVDSVPKAILRKAQAAPQIGVLFLGNSLMESGMNTGQFAAAWTKPENSPTAFNAGLGSSSPVEHYVLAHQILMRHDKVRYLVYGFFDFQLTQQGSATWGDLVGNRSMAYSMEPVTAADLYSPGSTAQRYRFQLLGAVPMLRDHSQIWKYVELLRRTLGEIGLSKAKMNEFGRVADFQEIAAPNSSQFAREAEREIAQNTPLIPAIKKLEQLAREHNAQLIIVEMPMTPSHREQYYSTEAWRKYRNYLQEQFQAGGVSYIQASDWAPDETDFSDGLHLNPTGANLFSKKLAQIIEEKMKRP